MRVRLLEEGWEHDLFVDPAAETPPVPRRDEVVIRVEACGVCHRDCIDRSGGFKFMRLPITPGHEAVGRVVGVGPAVTEWRPGDRVATLHRDFCGRCEACRAGDTSLCAGAAGVLGLLVDGGYSRWLRAGQRCFYRVPEDLPAAEAAVLHCTLGTAWRGLTRCAGLEAGERVVVTGANGGVGGAVVQLASAMGAEVVAIVRDEAHRADVMALGAHEVLVDEGDGFARRLGRRLADLAVDCVGEPTFLGSLRSLRIGGRLVVIGNVTAGRVALNLGRVITHGVRICGSSGATRADMGALLDRSDLQVRIDRVLPLCEADQAQRLVRAGGLHGRLVLDCGAEA